MEIMYDTLVLSGGGVNGFEMLGALHLYHEFNYLSNVKTFCGTSVGGMISMLLCFGFSPMDVLQGLYQYEVMQKTANIQLSLNGMLKFDHIREALQHMILRKFDSIPTLLQIYENTGKTWIVATYNTSVRDVEYLSYKTHPNMCCLDACQATSSVPFLFSDFEVDSTIYLDGGVIDNYPLIVPDFEFGRILAVSVLHRRKNYKDMGLMERFSEIFFALTSKLNKQKMELLNKTEGNLLQTVYVEEVEDVFSFHMGVTQTFNKFCNGYKQMKQNLKRTM